MVKNSWRYEHPFKLLPGVVLKIIITSSLHCVFVAVVAKISILGYFPKNPIFGYFGILGYFGHFCIFAYFQENPKNGQFWETAILANLGIFSISRKTGIFVKMVVFGNLIKKVKNGDFL